MHFSRMDAYFHLASHGDKQAYMLLYEEYHSRAESVTRITLSNYANSPVIPADFIEYVDFLFLKILNEYEPERGSFSWYTEYVLQTKLAGKITQVVGAAGSSRILLNDYGEDNYLSIEDFADPNQTPIASDLAIENFKYKIASPEKVKNKDAKIKNKILLLLYAGLKNTEICRKLNMTMGDLRGYLRRIKEDDDMINLKLDLK